MRNSPTRPARSPVWIAAALLGVTYFALLMFSLLTAPGEVVDAGALTAYVVARALVLTTAAFPAMCAAALLAATARPPRWGDDLFPVSLVRQALALAGAYALLLFAVDPIARRTVDASLFSGAVANAAEQHAKSLAVSDPATAIALSEILLAINPSHSGGVERYQSLRATISATEPGVRAVQLPLPSLRELGTQQLTALAVRFLELEDPYSGYHFADLSLQVAPTVRASAARAEAARRIASPSLTPEEIAAQSRFRRKRHAEAAGVAEDWEEAYYTWLELAAEKAQDPDIASRLPNATLEVSKVTYWLPDAATAALLPGAGELLFANGRHADGTAREVLRIGKLVRTGRGVFAHDIELLRLTPAGERALHVVADHGQILGDSLLLVGIRPERRQQAKLPEVLHGGDAPRSVALEPSVDDLYLLRQPSLARGGIGQLRRVAELRDALGASSLAERLALARTASKPMFTLALIAVAALVGTWARRAAAVGTWLELAMLPVVFLGCLLVADIWWLAHALIVDAAATALGLWAGLTVGAAGELLIAVVGMGMLARAHARQVA